ncbi:MAG: 23S rRNA (adenine(2503)-C(2))-methyltransferase RlmN, partial [Deltaproteobacteria bacterium]
SSLFPIKLAVSLHGPDNETRSRIMPINRRYPLEELLKACRSLELPRRNRITFEYLLLGGVNDSPQASQELARLLRGLRAKINLISFNEYAGAIFKAPSPSSVENFQKILQEEHFTATVRQSRGAGIMAACGQLSHSH